MMNYEVNPFQDYESITIDELKDQANSLLNLVTEEQRPLRVCMNNGKEFLLFPQDLLAPICDSDFRLILLSAMRYAMGRNTCMPVVVSDYIKRHIRLLDDKFLVLAADDIRRYLEDYAEHEPNLNLWQSLLFVHDLQHDPVSNNFSCSSVMVTRSFSLFLQISSCCFFPCRAKYHTRSV